MSERKILSIDCTFHQPVGPMRRSRVLSSPISVLPGAVPIPVAMGWSVMTFSTVFMLSPWSNCSPFLPFSFSSFVRRRWLWNLLRCWCDKAWSRWWCCGVGLTWWFRTRLRHWFSLWPLLWSITCGKIRYGCYVMLWQVCSPLRSLIVPLLLLVVGIDRVGEPIHQSLRQLHPVLHDQMHDCNSSTLGTAGT